jgi:thiol:disulfide interchange protein DsbD
MATFSIVMVFLLLFMPEIFDRIARTSNFEFSTRLMLKPFEIPRDTEKRTAPHLRFLAFLIIVIALLSLSILFSRRDIFAMSHFIQSGKKSMEWLVAICIQSSAWFFFIFLSLSILVAAFMLFFPSQFPAFSQYMNQWISTRKLHKGVDVFRDHDTFYMEHRLPIGIISLIILMYVIYACFIKMVDIQARFEEALQHGSAIAIVLAFFGGVGVSLTPCVFPIIPVTVAFIGTRNVSSRAQAFFISLSYVIGLALTYTAVGAFTALSGSFFQSVAAHWLTNLAVSLIFIVLGLSMLDVFAIPMPGFMQQGFANRVPASLRGTNAGAFLIGIASGLVVGTCTFPVLVALLTYIASSGGSLAYGGLLLFSYATGLGLIFLLAGTFSSLFTSFFKSGGWMNVVKKILASAIIITGLYFFIIAWKAYFG